MTLFLTAVLSALAVVGMATVFGGTAVLAFITAPSLFEKIEPRVAGDAFGLMLRRFDRLGLVAATLATACSVLLLLFTDAPALKTGLFALLALIAAACFLYSQRRLTPRLEVVAPPDDPEVEDLRSEAEREMFDRLHAQHVRLYVANLLCSVGALLLVGMAL